MRLLSKVLWLLAFAAATFCWMVLWIHGFTPQGFSKGVRQELGALVSLVNGGNPDDKQPPAPKNSKDKTQP